MNKFQNILIVLLFSCLSAMAGGYIAAKNVAVNYSDKIVLNSSTDIVRTVKILDRIRNNKLDEAIDSLENQLDLHISNIYMFGSTKLNSETANAVAIAKSYRMSSPPHKVNEKLKSSVEKILKDAKP